MSPPSEELLPESADSNSPPSARILQMKSTQYDLQRAIQQRAQESVDRERQLDEEQRRPKPLKWLIALVIAAIPVVLTLTAVDGFLRAMHRYIDVAVTSAPQNQPESSDQPEATDQAGQSSEPGVVLLQPLGTPEQAKAPETPASDAPATPAK